MSPAPRAQPFGKFAVARSQALAKPRRLRRWVSIGFLFAASAVLVLVATNDRAHGLTSGIRSAASHVYDPLRQGALDVVRPVGSVFANAFNYGSVKTQHGHLEYSLGQLKQQKAEQEFERAQLHALQSLLGISFLHQRPVVLAETTDENMIGFTATITVDKGTADGVDAGNAVVGHAGLLGQVVSLTPHSCVVRLITDSQSRVGVSFGPSHEYSAVAEGQGVGTSMAADYVPPTYPLQKGEVILTSAFSSAQLPPGIPVAKVLSFETPPGASKQTVALQPVANLQTIMYVAIVQ